ncbi:hypothetical protein L1987_76907 [Smallanthus sonchifolius]|uniref:Uncharacterized protein n=1 Tax=Smallanthus sonchifolius TaxID=185202 RepID=A0ACB8Z899_9ASTR|nr:hypothetical protein L1987_76907 [Smallanthus sonchifolius]
MLNFLPPSSMFSSSSSSLQPPHCFSYFSTVFNGCHTFKPNFTQVVLLLLVSSKGSKLRKDKQIKGIV